MDLFFDLFHCNIILISILQSKLIDKLNHKRIINGLVTITEYNL